MYTFAIFCLAFVPASLALLPFGLFSGGWGLMGLLLAPSLFALSFLVLAALIAQIGRPAIIPGRFPRQASNAVYGRRRYFGMAWTAVYYFRPLYWLVLSVPFLKKGVFRAFGYKGSMNFVSFPDTWIRDLPLLVIGEGAYLANRATIGTNMCLNDGTIMVGKITIGNNAMVGHLALIGLGSSLGDGSEIGTGAALGLSVQVGKNVKIGPRANINHGVIIGDDCKIGSVCLIDSGVVLEAGVDVPTGMHIPSKMHIRTQADIEALLPEKVVNPGERTLRVA